MKKLIFILMVGGLFADRIVFEQMGDTHTFDNVEFIKAGNGKVYFNAYGIESSKNCNQIREFTDNDGNPIDYDCSVAIDEPPKNKPIISSFDKLQSHNHLIEAPITINDNEPTQDTLDTLNTLISNQKKMLANQDIILDEVIYIDPLEGKKYGIEFNPAHFLLSTIEDEGFTLTGSVSLFSVSKSAEIAFPIFYKMGEDDLRIFHFDSHYRNFTGKHRNGFYLSSGIRFTQLRGREREGNSIFNWNLDESNEITSVRKIGLIFGIGYRIFGRNGWYWGISLFGGRYFTDTESSIVGAGGADEKAIIDMELLKIGKTF